MVADKSSYQFRKLLIDQINECYDLGCVVRLGMLKWNPGDPAPSGTLIHVYDPKTGESHKFNTRSDIKTEIMSSRQRSSYMASKPKPITLKQRILSWFKKSK